MKKNKHRKTSVVYLSLLSSLIFSCIGYAGGSPIASLNGAACNFSTIVDAIAAAQPNDVINIRGGTYTELLGEISTSSLTLVASRGITGCESGSNAFVTIDGMGQTSDATGGLVKITNSAKVTFRNISMTNASAINGGIMAVIDGSNVTLDNSDVYAGSALSAGGNVFVSVESRLVINNGSAIYGGTVITGDGGGIAIYDSDLLINNGSIGLMGISQGNLASNNGGGIYAERSSLVINNLDSQIQNNQSNNFGGGIFAVDSDLTIRDAEIKDNTSQISGGGIYLDSTSLILKDAIVSNNLTTDFVGNAGGGGLYLNGSSQAVIDSSLILSNTSETLGGGILSVDSTSVSIINGSDIFNNVARIGAGIHTTSPLSVDNSRVFFNTASATGGGINCHDCQNLSILNFSQISHNTASSSGGGVNIFANIATIVELKNSSFTGNTLTAGSSSFGAGISQDGGTLLMDTCTISSNSGSFNGGGVALFDLDPVVDSVRIINSQFSNNSTFDFGGALYLNEIFNAQITESEFNVNNSSGNGGAILVSNSNLIINESIISDNSAIFEGGGIHAEDSDLMIRNSSIIENEAVDLILIAPGNVGGGGIKAFNSNLDLINSKVNQNLSRDIGGGILYDGSINNSISIQSQYGVLANECLPSALGFNEYCSEVSNNTAIFGAGLMIRGSTNEQGITLSGIALNTNETIPVGVGSIPDSGVAIHIDISNETETNMTLENLMIVENTGINIGDSMIYVHGNVLLDILSSTIANNSGRSIQAEDSNSTIIVQNSILQQNDSGPLIDNSVTFLGLCNNSQPPLLLGQSLGADLGDPQFISTSRGDYRLSQSSPSLDSCTFGAILDIDGNVRPNDNSNYDQGAFEMNADFVVDEIFTDGFE